MEQADWKGFAARRAAASARRKLRGIGMATYVEKCSGGTPGRRRSRKFNPDDTVTLYHGQPDQRPGPRDGLRQIVSDTLGIDVEQIRLVQGDTDVAPTA